MRQGRLPMALKLTFTAFVAVLVPVYLRDYGPTNFLYFCDVALVMTLAAVWTENALWASAALVGILVPQTIWVVDFLAEATGHELTGLTSYMFNAETSLFLRGLSFFHFWLPFFLLLLLSRLGYDRRGFLVWSALAAVLLVVCYFFMPGLPAPVDDPNLPVNINYVYGLSEKEPQTWLPANQYFALMMVVLPLGIFLPTHLLLCWVFPAPHATLRSAGGLGGQ